MKSKESSKAGLVNPPADPSGRNGTFALFSTPSAFKDESEGNCRRGQPMIDRFRDFARALLTVLLLGVTGAAAQTSQSLTSPPPGAAPQSASAPNIQAGAVPAGPTGPQINIAEITTRANHDVGVRRSPAGSTSLIGWKTICAARDCIIQS